MNKISSRKKDLYHNFWLIVRNASDDRIKEMVYQFDKDDFLVFPIIGELVENKKIPLLQELYDKGCHLNVKSQQMICCGWHVEQGGIWRV